MSGITEWFSASVKPVRDGVYETRSQKSQPFVTYQYWNGEHWGYFKPTAELAFQRRHMKSCEQKPQWRGLAEAP